MTERCYLVKTKLQTFDMKLYEVKFSRAQMSFPKGMYIPSGRFTITI